ncbi:hypothetical protein PSU45_20750 [Yersinia pestis]|nr:hypothetical protein [Yersinia pestis]MDL0570829.1 hypothetical protein [Yersinia pestis]MDL0602364.1 hypothetical protein [Yersinia pestis]MDL0685528.1 hypothetical protein [Yersinia pestis]MDL0756763.1 hypothetical protein [Yersinia pestis]
MMSMGIRGIGVPCGKKWAKDALVLLRNPVITAPAHKGIAIPRFIDNWVVGVNE